MDSKLHASPCTTRFSSEILEEYHTKQSTNYSYFTPKSKELWDQVQWWNLNCCLVMCLTKDLHPLAIMFFFWQYLLSDWKRFQHVTWTTLFESIFYGTHTACINSNKEYHTNWSTNYSYFTPTLKEFWDQMQWWNLNHWMAACLIKDLHPLEIMFFFWENILSDRKRFRHVTWTTLFQPNFYETHTACISLHHMY